MWLRSRFNKCIMRLFRLLSLVVVLFAMACRHDVDTPVPEPENPDFELTIESTTRGSVEFSVVPKDKEAPYLCAVYSKAEYEDFMREEFAIEAIYQELREEASAVGKTFKEYMAEVVDRGDLERASFSSLAADTDYLLLVFGVDESRDYEATTAVAKCEFRTMDIPSLVCDFKVSTSVVDNSVILSVVPSDKEMKWYLCTMPVAQYDSFVESVADGTDSQFYHYYFQQEINYLLQQGYTEQQVVDALIHEGDVQLEAKGLKEYTDYCFFVAGLILDGEGIAVCTDVERGGYTTEGAAQSEMTFEIEVWDIGQMEASFRITPSNDTDKYCALVAPWDGLSTADEQMHQIVNQWGSWMDVMSNDRGMVEHSGSKAFKLPAADTDYYIIAFGYNGGITTEARMATFRTLPGGSVEEVEFTISATNISPYGFTMGVTSSDPTIYYVPGACVAGEFNEEEYIAYEEEAFAYYYEGSKSFNQSITICEVLDQYYYNGNCTVQVGGLLPDTEIMAYIFALDVHTGKVVKSFTFDNVARTSTLGVANPTVELVGYFSGDDEAGTIFGDAAATKGKAITVVKYNDLADVRTLFTTMVEGDCSNPTAYPDNELWGITDGYWKSCKLSSPYTFYLVDWNVEQTALAYATDNTGKVGNIARLYTMPTAENKGDIEMLKALVDELNATSRSLVIELE